MYSFKKNSLGFIHVKILQMGAIPLESLGVQTLQGGGAGPTCPL